MPTAQNNLLAIILCGGKSTRMGSDKALKVFHHQPQYAHLKNLILPITNKIVFSINHQQTYFNNEKVVLDQGRWRGPIDGVLSVIQSMERHSHFLVIGIDYPLLTLADIELLLKVKQEADDVVCYYHAEEDIAEPLVTLYDQRCMTTLLDYAITVENPSLRQFISKVNAHKINLQKPHNIISFDYENFHHE